MNIRTWSFWILALAVAGCASEATAPVDDDDATLDEPAIHPKPTIEDRASVPVQRGIGLALEACPGCGPVPDPWENIGGPVPDPWVPKASEPSPAPDGKKRP